MTPARPERRDSPPIPAFAAVLVAVLALSAAATADLNGSRHGRSLHIGAMLLCVDGPGCCPAFDVEHDSERSAPRRGRPSGTCDVRGDHDRVLGPVIASVPGRGDLPPPMNG